MDLRADRVLVIAAVALAIGGLFASWKLAFGDDPAPAASASESAKPPAGERPDPTAPARPERDRDPAAELAGTGAPTARPVLSLDHPANAYPVIWVRRGARVPIRTEPGGGKVVEVAGKRTEFGSPSVFGVVRRSGVWAGVTTAKLPNNRLGWIRLDPKRLDAGWTELSIVVDLSERRAELRRGDDARRTFAITVGAPGSDTPTGRFSVTDTFRGGLSPAYGCCAVAISATQPNLPSGWLGGRRIAIHGTSGPLGVAASLGCVRAADAEVSNLVSRVPLGTPVFIRG